MTKIGIIILAAGLGKRMKSSLPKVMHKLCGKPIIKYCIETALSLNPDICCAVLGYKHELVKQLIPDQIKISLQEQQLGTGHAVIQASEHFSNFDGKILILCGDVPLLKPATLKKIISHYETQSADAVILTAELENPSGYGRILRNEDNSVSSIVEEKDADKEIKLIKEINSGIYCFNSKLLFQYLPQLKNKNAQSEYYLTDIISLMVEKKHKVCAVKIKDYIEMEGINNPIQLAELEKETYRSTAYSYLEKGVIILDPENTYIDSDTKIGIETTVYPVTRINCSIIGKNCIITGSTVENCEIKDNVLIGKSVLKGSIIFSNSEIGDFNSISYSEIKQNSKIGNCNIIINSKLGQNTKIQNNCSIEYIESGKDCLYSNNSSICSFDGLNSHKSVIGNETFIGAGCSIVSPVNIGNSSYITSGTTVIKDVNENCLVMSRPETIIKQGYVDKLKKKLEPCEVK